jgi:hypothetical protein
VRDPGGGALSYQFEHSWQHERERLAALEGALDSCSTVGLTAIGIGRGWRCLESFRALRARSVWARSYKRVRQ